MFNPKIRKIAGSIGMALAMAYTTNAAAVITAPGGFAEAFLHFKNFQFRVGDSGLGNIGTPPISGAITISGTEKSTAAAVLNGNPATPSGCLSASPLGDSYSCIATIGAGFNAGQAAAALTPYTPVTASPLSPNSGSGGLSQSTGDSREGTAEVYLHSLSQLNTAGATNASSTQGVVAEFTLTVDQLIRVELSFDLERLVRAGLGQPGLTASADTKFQVLVKKVGGASDGVTIFDWQPNGRTNRDQDGACEAGSGNIIWQGNCDTYSDPFSLQSSVSVLTQLDRTTDATGNQINFAGATQGGFGGTGYFEAELNFVEVGNYSFEIISSATSATSINVPEPGTIALLGLGMLGLGVASRKQRRV